VAERVTVSPLALATELLSDGRAELQSACLLQDL